MPLDLTIDEIINHPNLAEELDSDELNTIGQDVLDGYEIDEGSREDYIKQYKIWMKLAKQISEERTWPWRHASNIKFPLVNMGAIQFHARAYPALIPSHNIVMGKIIGRDPEGTKQREAERIGTHMTHQLLDEMEDWESGFDKLLITLPITGCEFSKTYRDVINNTNISEYLPATDLVVNYGTKSLEKASRITQILEYTKNEVVEKERFGIWIEEEDEAAPVARDDEVTKLREEASGHKKPSIDKDEIVQNVYLEQHCYLDLDYDGYQEPYIVTINKATGKVRRIVARFNQKSVQYNTLEEIKQIKPIHYYTKYEFIPNPDGGFYSIGFGLLLGPINRTVDSLINQLVDSGTANNLQSGFISKNLKIRNGRIDMEPGEWKTVNATSRDLAGGILPLPSKDPSIVLFQLLGMLINVGEKMTSTTDMLVGENPGQNQKATTSLLVVDQGQKVFTAIYKRVRVALGKELKKLYQLNKEFVSITDYINVINPSQEELITLEEATDYQADYMDVIPSADPNMATQQQRQQKANMLMELKQMGVLNPQTQQDYIVSRRILDSLEIEKIDEVLALPPEKIPPSLEQQQHNLEVMKEKYAEEERQFNRQLKIVETLREEKESKDENEINEREVAVKELLAISKSITEARNSTVKAREAAQRSRQNENTNKD